MHQGKKEPKKVSLVWDNVVLHCNFHKVKHLVEKATDNYDYKIPYKKIRAVQYSCSHTM